ncbi:MAG: biopolymer transporter ExbD [Betaproteobacteria bacterium]|nr:biopolymer transporter ExbD [Betaproteobacteria bacterium]NBT74521.1 biopolymer transporter ExbD [Betaproteobacteria bacterium]NBY13526.1 biopolymer transporter ExbD [Betaproteobacteria bacterium]
MAFHVSARTGRNQPNAEINMVPLIDVMLVLVVIFIVTAPLMTHSVKVNLPKAQSAANEVKPKTISISINAQGDLFWDKEPLEWQGLTDRLRSAASTSPQPEIHIRADENVAYKKVAQVMSESAKAGLTKIGFITDPR